MIKKIVLIGYRAVGKTYYAKLISDKLGLKYCDTDELLESKYCKIPELVKQHGWDYFREKETEILYETLNSDKYKIISTGGGIIERTENITILQQPEYFVIWIKSDLKIIFERMKLSDNRPSLTGANIFDETEKILIRRNPLYNKTADYVFVNNEFDKQKFDDLIRLIRKKISV